MSLFLHEVYVELFVNVTQYGIPLMTSCEDPCMAARGAEWRSEEPGETGGSVGDRISG